MKKLSILIPVAIIIAVIFIFSDTLLLPVRFTYYSNLAQFHEARKQYDKAIHEYHKAASMYRENQILKHLIKLYGTDMKRFSEETKDALGPAGTEEKALGIVRRSPENPYTHIVLANYYLSRTFYREARKSFDEALRLNPYVENSIAKSLAILEYGQNRNIAKAITLFESFCKNDPAAVFQNPMLIKLYALGGRTEDKKQLLSLFVEKNQRTKTPRLLESLGYAHLGIGEYSLASSVFLQALRSRKASSDMMNGQLLADAHMMLTRADQIAAAQPEDAVKLIARAMRNSPSLWEKAAGIIEKHRLPGGLPGDPAEIHYVLAKSYEKKGRVGLMISEYKLAVKKDPGNFESVAALEKIYNKLKKPDEIERLRNAAQRYQTVAFTRRDLIGTNFGNLFSNGCALIKDVKLLSGGVAVDIQARGTPAVGVQPLMALFIDGRYVGTASVEREIKWYTFETDADTGNHLLEMRFPNDAFIDGADRNLFINAVKIQRK